MSRDLRPDPLMRTPLTRRAFLAASAAGVLALTACSNDGDPTATPADADPASPTPQRDNANASPAAQATTRPATPACDDGDEPTVAQTEGPFFTPNSPERTSLLEPGIAGTRLTVSGVVLRTDCTPVAGALLDFWQADNNGNYDNEGFRLRGHQFAGADGAFTLETILPARYPGRTRHIHVKVQAANEDVLTTQLYFPGEPGNSGDGIFDPALVMDVADDAGAKRATFDFVLPT